jgi:type II secretory pathway component PulF
MALSIPSSHPVSLAPSTASVEARATASKVRIRPNELLFFTSQLALMVEVGTSLDDALRLIARQCTNAHFASLVLTMSRQIEEGRQLSDTMHAYPRVFDGTYVSMVRAGEAGGFLEETLTRLVDLQEKRMALVGQIRNALTYPLILSVMAVGVVIFILVGVLPKFTAFFAGKESILPWPTRFLMGTSASIQAHWWAYLVGIAGVVTAITLFRRSPFGRRQIDRFEVGFPLVRGIYTKIYTCRMLRTLGQLLQSQVPLLEALQMTRLSVKNLFYQELVDRISGHVEQGSRLSQAMVGVPLVKEHIRQMVATGEEAGQLHPVMLRLAEFHDKEIERDLKRISATIEPLTLIVLGSVVGFIVASVVLPLFKLAHALQ